MFFVYSLGLGWIWSKSAQFCSFLPIGCTQKKLMPGALRDEQMLCAKMYSLPKVKVSRLYTAVSRCQICLLQWIFQREAREATKPLENQMFFVYSLGLGWIWRKIKSVQCWSIYILDLYKRSSLCIPWVWAGFVGNVFNFKVFTLWIYTKEVGAQPDEEHKC